jgi:hypothetical protein
LGGPLEEGVLLGEVDDFLAGERGIDSCGSHVVLIANDASNSPQRHRDTESLKDFSYNSPRQEWNIEVD